ncbi:MAG: hypothetical protein JWO77_3342 [Ilumatobacteraceae bacterium]|nr:hypothetical protein [Ilumatobacteraceae bacterium]
MGVALVATVAVTFAPWLRSGEARRDSHELVRTAERLGVFEGVVATAVRVGWAFLPFVAALGLLALVRGWRRTGFAAALTVGVVVLLVGFGLQAAGDLADWGATAAIVVGAVSAGGGAIGLISGRSGRDQR